MPLFSSVVISLLAASSQLDAGAVASPPARNAALMNLGDLLNGGISVEYERGLVDWLGLSLGLGISGFVGPFDSAAAWKPSASVEGGVRLHLGSAAPSGFWLGPTARFVALMPTASGSPIRPWAWGLGAAVGYHFVVLPRLVLQLGAAAGFTDFGAGLVWEPRLRLGVGFVI